MPSSSSSSQASSSSMATLVQKVTKATGLEISKELMKPIKQACKNDGSVAVKELVRCLLQVLSSSKNVGIKVRVLSIIDEMFWRSREFREEISAHIRVVSKHIKLVYSGPINTNSAQGNRTSSSGRHSGGSGSAFAGGMEEGGTDTGRTINDDALLHDKWKTMMVLWDGCYGPFLPELRGFVRYLAEGMKTPLPDMNSMLNTHAREVHRQEEVARHRIVTRCDEIVREAQQALPDIADSLTEIDHIFALIFPSVHDNDDNDDAGGMDVTHTTSQKHGLGQRIAASSSSSRSSSSSSSSSNDRFGTSSSSSSSSGSGSGTTSADGYGITSSSHSSGGGLVSGTEHVWECDGVELDDEEKDGHDGACDDDDGDAEEKKHGENVVDAGAGNAGAGNADDDDDDVEWEEEDTDPPPPTSSSSSSSSSSALATATLAAPYTINISFAVTAQGT